MAQVSKALNEVILEILTWATGWIIGMGVAASAYFLAIWLAPHFHGAAKHQGTFALLSVVVMIWLYEHRVAHARYERLKEIIEKNIINK